MTVIAWDGKTLAADKRMGCNGYPATTTKIFRTLDGALMGGCGESDMVAVLRQWYANGADPAAYPSNRNSDGTSRARLLVIKPDGLVMTYANEPVPVRIEDTMFAIGSGGDFALAAMHLGHDARRAVEVACALDSDCGNGIDTLQLKEDAPL